MTTTRKRLLAFSGLVIIAVATIVPAYRAHLAAEAKGLVEQLSWDSVGGNCVATCLIIFPDGPAAERLVRIGRPASAALLRVLDDPARGVAAHLILTRIYHPDRTGTSSDYHWDETRRNSLGGPKITDGTHTVNGLRWHWYSEGDRHSVDSAELKQNFQRWHAEL